MTEIIINGIKHQIKLFTVSIGLLTRIFEDMEITVHTQKHRFAQIGRYIPDYPLQLVTNSIQWPSSTWQYVTPRDRVTKLITMSRHITAPSHSHFPSIGMNGDKFSSCSPVHKKANETSKVGFVLFLGSLWWLWWLSSFVLLIRSLYTPDTEHEDCVVVGVLTPVTVKRSH